MIVETCSKHPTYKAVGKPRSMCVACWTMWEQKEAERTKREAEENEVSAMTPPADLTDEALREIALGIVEDKIFTDRHCRSMDEVQRCFPVLAFMKLCDRKFLAANPPGLVWEFYSKASPMGVNGLPMFFSLHMINQGDAAKVEMLIRDLYAKRQAFLSPSSDEPTAGTGPCGEANFGLE